MPASSTDALLQEAIGRHGAGDLAQAEALCRQALRLAPGHADALHLLGVIHLQSHRVADGIALIRKSLDSNPRQPFALTNIAMALMDLGQFHDALDAFDRALSLGAGSAETFHRRGDALSALGRVHEALASYARAVQIEPQNPAAQVSAGRVLAALNRHEEAVACFDAALQLRPDLVEALIRRGNALLRLRRPSDALESYDAALHIAPAHADAWLNRASCLTVLERADEAITSCERAIALDPSSADAFNNRGLAELKLHRYEDTLESFDRALELDANLAIAHANRGRALVESGRVSEAIASYERAIAIEPNDFDALANLGYALIEMKRSDDALVHLDRALRLRPDDVGALNNRGRALIVSCRLVEALACFELALRQAPDYAHALCNRGTVLLKMNRGEEALSSCAQALALEPDNVRALKAHATVLARLNLHEQAAQSLARALELDSDLAYGLGDLAYTRLYSCDWQDFTACVQKIRAAGAKTCEPLVLLGISDNAAEQRRCAERFVADQCPATSEAVFPAPQRHERIRLAYLSADFRDHPVARLMAELVERHDRQRFEVTAVSFGPSAEDPMRQRLRRSFEHFLDVSELSDRAIAEQLRAREIDIAVDLTVYTRYGRPQILAHRPAPLQATFLGYPGTTGAPFVDYLIADAEVIPEEHAAHYSEYVVRLPDCYLPGHAARPIAAHTPTREELGLPEHGFVFCCFNNAHKILPDVFACWMRMVRETPGSVLWLRDTGPAAARNLQASAERAGVEPDRIRFAPRLPLAEHLARHRQADLFLDTLPYTAHSTAADALWAGLPILTCRGESFVARVGSSLLLTVGLPELVTDSLEEYTARALQLAHNPA
jgi:predicted O-linked N-acetylglucosamine transferase (SPINDLY family)